MFKLLWIQTYIKHFKNLILNFSTITIQIQENKYVLFKLRKLRLTLYFMVFHINWLYAWERSYCHLLSLIKSEGKFICNGPLSKAEVLAQRLLFIMSYPLHVSFPMKHVLTMFVNIVFSLCSNSMCMWLFYISFYWNNLFCFSFACLLF